MLDVIYVLGTGLFFALMLAYVAGCARLGSASRLNELPSHESR